MIVKTRKKDTTDLGTISKTLILVCQLKVNNIWHQKPDAGVAQAL